MDDRFRKFAARVSGAAGEPWAFILAFVMFVGWSVAGWFIGFSDRWQFALNTPATIITFLMVFLIQNAANRHAFATQLKLDELIRAIGSARNQLIDLEHLSDEELSRLKQGFERLRDRAARETEGHSSHAE